MRIAIASLWASAITELITNLLFVTGFRGPRSRAVPFSVSVPPTGA